MMGASGFTQDKMACIRVSHKIRLNAHLSTVNTAASKAGSRLSSRGNWPVSTHHVNSRNTRAVSQQATKLDQSIRLPGGTILRIRTDERRVGKECVST